MDWSTVTLILVCMFVLGLSFIAWLFFSLAMRLVRMFTRTTKKTMHVLSAPYPRKR